MFNRYILSSVVVLTLCLAVGCADGEGATVGTSTTGEVALVSDESGSTDATEATTVTTAPRATTVEETTTHTSLAPSEYKSIMEDSIDQYEVMLMELNDVVQNFDGTPSWDDSLESCLDTSQYYLDYMDSLTDTGAVPKKYSKSHTRITYCMEQYTLSIRLIQQAIEYYQSGEESSGDDTLNEALNRSQIANKVWSEVRGYANAVEYTGETLEPQVVYSEEEQQVFSDELETIVLQTPEQTTPQTTFQQYNDGYAFGDDNVYIYSE